MLKPYGYLAFCFACGENAFDRAGKAAYRNAHIICMRLAYSVLIWYTLAMIRLSKLTDYAIVLLSQIVRMDGKVATTTTLTAATGLPYPTVSKVLKTLTRGGLLHAQRGATGGYALSRSSTEISVADVVQAMDGPIAITDCVEGGAGGCGIEKCCPLNGHWNKINRVVQGALAEVSLREIAFDVPQAFRKPEAGTRSSAKS